MYIEQCFLYDWCEVIAREKFSWKVASVRGYKMRLSYFSNILERHLISRISPGSRYPPRRYSWINCSSRCVQGPGFTYVAPTRLKTQPSVTIISYYTTVTYRGYSDPRDIPSITYHCQYRRIVTLRNSCLHFSRMV